MSDYYYFHNKNEEWGFTPVPGDEYILALKRIAKKHGLKITDKMILEEVYGKNINYEKPIKKIAKSKMKGDR